MQLWTIALIIVGVIALLGGGIVATIAPSDTDPADNAEGVAFAGPAQAWIEVMSAEVFLLTEEGGVVQHMLQSGDELNAGAVIATDTAGRAIVHFPDGSLARIDGDTEFILEVGDYNQSDETLTVAITLSSGRIWSSIVELVTPVSLWEVKTANAVAVVRGTAFGTEYINGASRVIGSENAVAVIPIDPVTNKRVEEAAVVITPEKFVEITKEGVAPIRDIPEEIKEATWVKQAKEADAALPKVKEERREQSEQKFRRFEEEREKAIELLKKEDERFEKAEEKTDALTDELFNELEHREEPRKIEAVPAPSVRNNRIIAEKLVIEVGGITKTIREGEQKKLRAFSVMSDGARHEVTDRVRWRVIGAIGTVKPDGVFTPKLIGTQAEFGSAVGSITATLKTDDGRELLGTTPTFEVKAATFENTDNLELRG